MLIVLGHSALVIAASFTSRMVKVTSEVLFVSIFHWWFDDTPWVGCFDAFWWIASFLLYGDLWLRLWWIIRNIGVWHLHWHWCVFLPLFSTSRCKRWNELFQLCRLLRCMIVFRPLKPLPHMTVGSSFPEVSS